MRKKNRISIATTSLILLSAAGTVWADDPPAAAAAKPVLPSVSDLLTASGLTLTGYVDATAAYSHISSSLPDGIKTDYNSFALNQAAFTLAMQPMSGFGALVNVVAGSNPNFGIGNGLLAGASDGTLNESGTAFYLMQAFAQYANGPWTVQAGKFATLAGAEVFAPSGNTNVTRSILFNYEPVTHTGVRATYAASDKLSLIVGVNNGWTGNQELSDGSDKTLEVGLSLTPNKMFAWTLQAYYGRDFINSNWDVTEAGTKAQLLLVDTVLTWNATSAITVIGSADYGNVGSTSTSPSASWYGIAAYLNYAINDTWRVSLRGEYFDDQDGYETGADNIVAGGTAGSPDVILTNNEKLQEVTLTLGYDPAKNFELRVEGRDDFPSPSFSTTETASYQLKSYQGWLEALYKF